MSNLGLSAATAAHDLHTSAAVKNHGGEKRRSPRIAIRLPGFAAWQDDGTERVEKVFTTSVSRFGCAIESHTFFHPGTRVQLEFGGKIIQGRVVHSLKDHSVNVVTTGVAFDQDGRDFWPVGFELGR